MRKLDLTNKEAGYLLLLLKNLFSENSWLGEQWRRTPLSQSEIIALGMIKAKLHLAISQETEK